MMDHSITKIVDGEKELTDLQQIFTKTYADQFKFEDGEPTLQGIPDDNSVEFGMPELERQISKTKEGTWT